MHELGLAQNIIDTVCSKVDSDPKKISAINIDVGALSGVVGESLEFCLQTMLESRELPNIRVNVNKVSTVVRCACKSEYQIENIFEQCPQCGSFSREVLSGKDLVLKSIELRD